MPQTRTFHWKAASGIKIKPYRFPIDISLRRTISLPYTSSLELASNLALCSTWPLSCWTWKYPSVLMPLSHPLWGVTVSRSSEEHSWFWITGVLCSLPSFCTNPKTKAWYLQLLHSKERKFDCSSRVVQQLMLCRVADVISHGIINISWWDRNLIVFCKKIITDISIL